MAAKPRKDSKRVSLRKGESQRKDGTYTYRWTDSEGKRRAVYAPSLQLLREKEACIVKDATDGIRTEVRYVTVNDAFDRWKQVKRGLRDNTMANYTYMYEQYVRKGFGENKLSQVKKSQVRQFYNLLVEQRGLKPNTVDAIHTVLHQVFDFAVEDEFIRTNPTDQALKELRVATNHGKTRKSALTLPEQERFLSYLRSSEKYSHWYPVFAVMIGTGLRVGEVTGLRWCDVDLETGTIDVNHTLVNYSHGPQDGCRQNIHPPKTLNSERIVPMLGYVKEAFLLQKEYVEKNGLRNLTRVDGYGDFIFVNRFGEAQHYGTLNKAITRIVRDCNMEALENKEKDPVLLPPFSCHTLRHTFATRMVEAGVNIKVVQNTLGHARVSTTLDIYTDMTKEFQKSEFASLDQWFSDQVS